MRAARWRQPSQAGFCAVFIRFPTLSSMASGWLTVRAVNPGIRAITTPVQAPRANAGRPADRTLRTGKRTGLRPQRSPGRVSGIITAGQEPANTCAATFGGLPVVVARVSECDRSAKPCRVASTGKAYMRGYDGASPRRPPFRRPGTR